MKLEFYHEAILEKFERFTLIGIQLNKHQDGEYYLNLWFIGFGVLIIFSDNNKEKYEKENRL
jgi:hypothetical protein